MVIVLFQTAAVRSKFSLDDNTISSRSKQTGRIEAAYMAGLDAVDRIEVRAASNKTSGKFTHEGARDDVLNHALNNLIPDLHKAQLTIKRQRQMLRSANPNSRSKGRTSRTSLPHSGEWRYEHFSVR